LSDKYPDTSGKTNIVCPHGDYLIHYRYLGQGHARKVYNIPEDKLVILNFGRQRPYKNGDFITSAFKKLGIDSKYLVIAGVLDYPDNGRMRNLLFRMRNKMRKSLKYSDRKFIYRHFSTPDIPEIISCADIIFLGQKHALNSGLLPLAATFGKPIVCPDTGCFREAVSEWYHEIYTPGDITGASNALQLMCERVLKIREESGSLDNSAWLSGNSWEKHVKIILSHISPADC
jgi:glycosyltransferase involved in cell wall biosynthesis